MIDLHFQINQISGLNVISHREIKVSGFHHILLVLIMKRIPKVSVVMAKVYVMGLSVGSHARGLSIGKES